MTTGAWLQATRTVPIVLPLTSDPAGAGLVDSLARPGGKAAGFMTAEFSIGGSRPGGTRATILRDATQGSGAIEFAVILAAAPSLRVGVSPFNMRDAGRSNAPSRPLRALRMTV